MPADEASQVWFHHVACDPRSCAHLKSPTPYGIQPVRPASRVGTTRPRPGAPCDPASGSRTGGALRRLGEGAMERAGLVLAGVARGPFGSSGPSCDPRTGGARWGEGAVASAGVTGWGTRPVASQEGRNGVTRRWITMSRQVISTFAERVREVTCVC